jgi:hypothetical protein
MGDAPIPAGYVRQVVMLYPLLLSIYRRGLAPRTLPLSDVSNRILRAEQMFTTRYEHADASFPMLAVEGAPNPDGKPFRVLDGRHRICRLRERGATTGQFFVLDLAEIEPWIGYDDKPASDRVAAVNADRPPFRR